LHFEDLTYDRIGLDSPAI